MTSRAGYGDAYVPPRDDAPGTTASVARMPIDLGDARGLVLHVSLLDGVGNGDDELVVLRELEGDAYCLLGTIELAHDECDTSCLEGDGPPFAVSTVHLVSPEHDALRVTTSGGACCSSERGDYSNVALYGVEGDGLVEYVSVQTYSAWYTSPWPPIQWTEAEVEVLDVTYPARIRVTERTECEPGCAAADAPEEGDAEGEDDDWSVDEECGPDAYTCEPSERTTLYVRRGRGWERAD